MVTTSDDVFCGQKTEVCLKTAFILMRFLTFLEPLIRWVNLFPLWRWGCVPVWGRKLRAPTFDRWLCLWLHRLGLMGRADHTFLLTRIQPGMTVLDIGANQGLYTLLFSQQVGDAGRVFAFEPDDMLHTALRDNVLSNHASNVRICHHALGSAHGTMTLYRSLLNSGDNRLAPKSRDNGPREAVRIQMETVDALLTGQRVDFIKMDVQGWEMEVLRGMEHLMDDPQNVGLEMYLEFWPQGLKDAGSDPVELLALLLNKGFHLYQASTTKLVHIVDVIAFSASVKTGSYLNLFATRALIQQQA